MNWQPPTATAPEEFADVLMAVHGEAHAAEGFRDHCGTWWYSTGHEVPGNAVYAFAELPDCPMQPLQPFPEGPQGVETFEVVQQARAFSAPSKQTIRQAQQAKIRVGPFLFVSPFPESALDAEAINRIAEKFAGRSLL